MAKRNPYKGPDANTLRAKRDGYPARSVYKLEEIDRRIHLFRPGMTVLDLGASPGSWSLYALEKIGKNGKLLAIDLKPLDVPLPPSGTFILGDARETASLSTFAPYDVVLSDMAPNTSGNRMADQARSFELFMFALDTATKLTKEGGAFVGKIFMGEDFPAARQELKKHFATERIIRPEGTRSVSFEIFLVGQDRKKVPAPAGAAGPT
jgi:23S rRNA (uridine2552-2'-O)-methyltransferase